MRLTITTLSCDNPPSPEGRSTGSSLLFTLAAGGSPDFEYDLFYLAGNGAEWLYRTFQGGDVITQQTFTGHQWVLRKKSDGACLEWFVFEE